MELHAASVPGQSLRARQKEATRRELRDAALALFERKGFARTSVDEIARAAGVSRSTFFRYFPSKETIVVGDVDENADLFLDLLRKRPLEEGRMRALEETLIQFAEALGSDVRRPQMLLMERIVESEPSLSARRAATVTRWRPGAGVKA